MSGRRVLSLRRNDGKSNFHAEQQTSLRAQRSNLCTKRDCFVAKPVLPAPVPQGTGEPSRRVPRNDTQLRLFMNPGSYFVYSPENYVPFVFDFRLLTFFMSTQLPTPNAASQTAIILVGGKSSRMGQSKALLPFGGEPLIVHSVRTLQRYFSQIVVVAAPEQQLPTLPVTLVRDEVAYQGPVGGIFYGLRAATHDLCFVSSCDAPFLNLRLIDYFFSLVENYDVVVPFWEERLQPLHAVYRRSVAPLLQDQLERGELRPVFLYKKVRTYEVPAEDIRRFDPDGLSFRNLNSPADYQAALSLWQQHQHSVSCVVELFGVARLNRKSVV